MGKVIKGSSGSEERYTVAVPSLVVAPPSAFAPARFDAAEAFAPAPEPEAPPEPQIDFAALEAQAQAIIDEAGRSAQALVDDAERRAAELLDEATHRAQTLAEEARRNGRETGYADGVAEVHASMAEMIATLGEIVEAARAERHALLASAEPELVRLAVGIAERVLHQQIALDTGVVVEMARAAIARIVDRERITVRVNPADIEQMRGHRDELLALGDVKNMRVIEDQRVDRGGVILETDAGSIDAKISTQLAEVRKILHIVDDVVVLPPAPQSLATSTGSDGEQTPLTAARAS
jgi:flagellar assembly protein FliH